MSKNTEFPNAFLIIAGSKIFQIDSEITKIGRSFDNDLVFEYPQVSRKHAELRYSNGQFEIQDLGSTGGTFVNGVKIKQQQLKKGDVISLVNLHLVFGQDELPDQKHTTNYRKPKDAKKGEQDTIIFPREDE
jgi:pSer/pThr/pTyr-binding forkhead associated (FHA) protein